MARILIIGAAGFIRSHLFDYLNGKHDVYGIDDYSIGNYRHDKIYNVDLKDASEDERIVKEVKPPDAAHITLAPDPQPYPADGGDRAADVCGALVFTGDTLSDPKAGPRPAERCPPAV